MRTINVLLLLIFAQLAQADNHQVCKETKLPELPSSYEFAIDYQDALYTWINCFAYKNVSDVEVDKEVRQTGPFVALKDYGTHPAVRIWYSPEVVAWLKADRPHTDGKASPEDLPNGAFILKEMYLSPATIYNELADAPAFASDPDGVAYEAMLETLISSWVVMIKDRSGPSADGWYWAQTEPNPNTTYANPPNYNPVWLDNYTSTPLDVYRAKDGRTLEVPKPHFLYSDFSTGTCIRCHASSSSESTFASLTNIDPARQALQFRVDNSWRAESYLDKPGAGTPSLIARITGFKQTFESGGQSMTIDGRQIFNDYLKPIWYLPAVQRPYVSDQSMASVDVRDAHLPSVEEKKEDDAAQAAEVSRQKKAPAGNTINKDFVSAFRSLKQLKKLSQPTDKQLKRFSFPPAFSDHSFNMHASPERKPAYHSDGSTGLLRQEYITSDNCVGCHGGLAGAPSGVSQFLQTEADYGKGFNISPYGEWRWSPMGLAGRDPVFHAQIESELLLLLKENDLLNVRALRAASNGGENAQVLQRVRILQQGLVDTCLRCHGAMGLRQQGLDQSPETIEKHVINFSQSADPVQQLVTKNKRHLINPQFDLDNFLRTVPPSAETQPFKPWANPPLSPPALNKFSDELGNLAREGISCTVCHRIAPPGQVAVTDFINTAKQAHPDWITLDGQVWTDEFFAFLALNNTGLYQRSQNDQILGPYTDVRQKPMQHALALTPDRAPLFNLGTRLPDAHTSIAEPFTKDSAMCGTCHTINLPTIGAGTNKDETPILRLLQPNPIFQELPHSIEQATYLEWLNSDFGPGMHNTKGPEFQSCQDCHMPNRSPLARDKDTPLAAQIATIQDANYPVAEHQLPSAEIDVPLRADYSRHELVGLNGFMLAMFKQNPEVLNVNLTDIETYADNGVDLALENMVASTTSGRVATVALQPPKLDNSGDNLVVTVTVKNNTGHRFPSGVAFRRAWLELVIKDAEEHVMWSSGTSNDAGIIVDSGDKQLDTEFLQDPSRYQLHYQEICSEDRVQIYEELTKNGTGEFTTSFVHRVTPVKDNRLLPRGWVPANEFAGGVAGSGDLPDQGELLRQIMHATDPEGVGNDPDFNANPGGDSVRYRIPLNRIKTPSTIHATLYSQAVTPAWQWDRFSMANSAKQAGFDTPATDRLFYLMSTLDLSDSPMQGWKFKVGSASATIPARPGRSDVPEACNQPYPE